MGRSAVVLACAILGGLAGGCVDLTFEPAEPTPGGTETVARSRFERDVYPLLARRCAGCHGESTAMSIPFVGATAAGGYARFFTYPALAGGFQPNAPIAIVAALRSHHGVLYAPDELAAIRGWLGDEYRERGEPPPPTFDALLSEWSGCILLSDFEATSMAANWSALSTPNGACPTCHQSSADTLVIAPQPVVFWDVTTTRRANLVAFFTLDPTRGEIAPNIKHIEEVSRRVPPYAAHPAFLIEGSSAIGALHELHRRARLTRLSNKCAPPRLRP